MEFHYRWQWRLQSPAAKLWPLIADTNRFNADTGLPPVTMVGEDGSLPNARRQLRFYRLGLRVEWVEDPFQWVEGSSFTVTRRYLAGPIKEMRVVATLAPDGNGTTLTYEVWATGSGLLSRLAIPLQIGVVSKRSFGRAFLQYDREVAATESSAAVPAPVPQAEELASPHGPRRANRQATPRGQPHLEAASERLLAAGAERELVMKLASDIHQLDEALVSQMRPYEVADRWRRGRREVLELFLLATREGMLAFEWDLLCPLCRGTKATTATLAELEPDVHCGTCNIDFTVNFERQVELTFHPAPTIRAVERGEYCVAGPRVTPHVVAQQLLEAGKGRRLRMTLEPGRYRMRAFDLAGGAFLSANGSGDEQSRIRLADDGWPDEELHVGGDALLQLENASSEERLMVLERTAWSDQAATAAEVTALQRFRDLFAAEALRPGQRISVGTMAILFTDLCGSTAMYNEIGDAPAFGLVMSHFDVLNRIIDEEGGAVVKTIGDAVMAAFCQPAAAVRAICRCHSEVAGTAELSAIRLKAGMHSGPCTAVTLNDRLDYFGSTVNIASRLEHLSEGGDVVISSTITDDLDVRAELASGDVSVVEMESGLRGFGDERFSLRRLTLAR